MKAPSHPSTAVPPRASLRSSRTRSIPLAAAAPDRGAGRLIGALAALTTLLVATPGRAQAFDDEFSVQRFDPAPGPRNFFTTRGLRVDGEMAWSAGLFVNYGYEPFVVESCRAGGGCSDIPVVENMVTGDLLGSLTPIPRLQIGLKIPVTWANGQGLTPQGTADLDDGLEAVGLGDPKAEAKYRVYGEVDDPLVLGGGVFVSAPLGTLTAEQNYIGDPTPTAGLMAIADFSHGPFSGAVNLAPMFRGEGRVGETTVGPFEFQYGAAAGYAVGPVVRVVLDAFGRTRFSSEAGTNALELDGGVQVTPYASPLAISAGAGVGLIEGVGVPAVRGFLGVIYVDERRDRDNDGVDDVRDQCPTEPEDRDGYEDHDGCPELDNDGDTIQDSADRCPNDPEDPDGFEDTDGCPDLDNDKDGIPDDQDACPNEPETKNGFKDEDGCPDELDTDNDGVPDERDQCPNEPEDTDGFDDLDGCPDPDNDNDGIPDVQDECIDEPETFNGFQDEDGCPDENPDGEPAPGAQAAPAPRPAPAPARPAAPPAAPAPAAPPAAAPPAPAPRQ